MCTSSPLPCAPPSARQRVFSAAGMEATNSSSAHGDGAAGAAGSAARAAPVFNWESKTGRARNRSRGNKSNNAPLPAPPDRGRGNGSDGRGRSRSRSFSRSRSAPRQWHAIKACHIKGVDVIDEWAAIFGAIEASGQYRPTHGDDQRRRRAQDGCHM